MSTKNIPYVRLGKSGLKVSKIILGCMSYGTPGWQGWVLDEKESIEHIKFAYEHGINTFDTANAYSNGLSEEILGKAIKQIGMNRDEIVVMTKCFFVVGDDPHGQAIWAAGDAELNKLGYTNRYGLSRKHIFDSVDKSLKRLGLDYIDVLQCHRFDYSTPVEEVMHALHDIVKSGKVRYVGMSSCYAWQFHVMQNYAIANNLTPFISMQNHYNLVYREEEREMVPTLEHFGVGMIPWSPLARGLLTRPFGATTTRASTDGWAQIYNDGPGTEAVVKKVEEIAKKNNLTMAQTALAWIMAKSTAPIIGTTSIQKLEDLLGAVNVKLSDEDLKALEEPYVSRSTVGHW